jgi:glycosyltransferase involved in cell wall biosynthesis
MDDTLVTALRQELAVALHGCDVVFVHNMLSISLNPFAAVALASLICMETRTQWVVWCEDLSVGSRYTTTAGESIDLSLLACSRARFVTITRTRRDQLAAIMRAPVESIDVVAPPLGEPWMAGAPSAMAAIHRHGLDTREPLVVVPAKLLPHKRLWLAVDLARELKSRFVSPSVVLTGAFSPHEPDISAGLFADLSLRAQHLASGSLVVLSAAVDGELDSDDVRTLMQRADVVYLPSAEEGFGLPVAEAIALGVPIICSDIPAFRESGEGWATYVDVDATPVEIADLVVEIASTPAAHARRRVRDSERHFRDATLRLTGYPNV